MNRVCEVCPYSEQVLRDLAADQAILAGFLNAFDDIGILVFDPDMRLVGVNATAFLIWGEQPENLPVLDLRALRVRVRPIIPNSEAHVDLQVARMQGGVGAEDLIHTTHGGVRRRKYVPIRLDGTGAIIAHMFQYWPR